MTTLPMNRSAAVPSRSSPKSPGRVKVWTRYAISDTQRLGQPQHSRWLWTRQKIRRLYWQSSLLRLGTAALRW